MPNPIGDESAPSNYVSVLGPVSVLRNHFRQRQVANHRDQALTAEHAHRLEGFWLFSLIQWLPCLLPSAASSGQRHLLQHTGFWFVLGHEASHKSEVERQGVVEAWK